VIEQEVKTKSINVSRACHIHTNYTGPYYSITDNMAKKSIKNMQI